MTGSHDALVDVAPPPSRAWLAGGNNRVVGLLIVRLGVLVRRGIRAGHPAARQAQPQRDPAVAAGQARLAAGRPRLTAGRPRLGLTDRRQVLARRRLPVPYCGVNRWSHQTVTFAGRTPVAHRLVTGSKAHTGYGGNQQPQQGSSVSPITDHANRLGAWHGHSRRGMPAWGVRRPAA